MCQNSFIFTITRTVKPDILLITSSAFAYYSNISFYEAGTFTHTALCACAACIRTLAQFTPPEKGYLWQLIMPPFMHIKESCEQCSLLCREEKQFQPKWETDYRQNTRELESKFFDNFPFLMSLGVVVFLLLL